MGTVLIRLAVLALGLGIAEIGLGAALVYGSLLDWALVGLGLLLIVGGSASFMVPLFGVSSREERSK